MRIAVGDRVRWVEGFGHGVGWVLERDGDSLVVETVPGGEIIAFPVSHVEKIGVDIQSEV